MAGNIPPGPPPSPWAGSPAANVTPYIPAIDGGGSFATNTRATIPPNRALFCFAIAGFTATLTGVFRNGQTIAMPAFPAAGARQIFSGAVFQEVRASAADADILYFTIPDGPYSPFDWSLAGSAGSVVTPAGWTIGDDGSGNLEFTDPASTDVFEFDSVTNGGALKLRTDHAQGVHNAAIIDIFNNTAAAGFIGTDGNGNINIFDLAGHPFVAMDNTSAFFGVGGFIGLNLTSAGNARGLWTKYDNRTLAGIGMVPVFGAGAQTLYTNAAPTTLSVTPSANAGKYRLRGRLNILTGGTLTFKVKVTYHDASGNPQSDIPVFFQQNSATLLAGGPSANSTGRFWFDMEIDVDNSATAITIADNAGTYTAGTYYWIPSIEEIV